MQSIRVDIKAHWMMGRWTYGIRVAAADYPTAAEMFTVHAGEVYVSERETELDEAVALVAAILRDLADVSQLPGID